MQTCFAMIFCIRTTCIYRLGYYYFINAVEYYSPIINSLHFPRFFRYGIKNLSHDFVMHYRDDRFLEELHPFTLK